MFEQLCLVVASLFGAMIVWIASICFPATIKIGNITTTISVVFLATLIAYAIQRISFKFVVRLDEKYKLHERIRIIIKVKPTKYRKGYDCLRTAEDMEDAILNDTALKWVTKTAQILLYILAFYITSKMIGEPTLIGITPKIMLGVSLYAIDCARKNLITIIEVAQLIDDSNAF